jgi:Photosynthetic reaction centre cytochrome C subunit
MKKTVVFSGLLISILIFSMTHSGANKKTVSPEDSLAADRMKYMNLVMASIKGKEKMRADSVFKNLQVIKGTSSISAEHLLWMMNWEWSTKLGVSCSYCHSIGNWESDSLGTKDIARGMWNMRVQINKEILPKITGRNYEKNPKVTCITCHRGKPIPAN